LALRDKALWDKFLNLTTHELSAYAFENIYVWKGTFDIYWTLTQDNLCIFFKDKIGCFLYLPPLGVQVTAEPIEEAFRIMDKFNHNSTISRIENVEEKDLSFYRDAGYTCKDKYPDYLCKRTDLVKLKGNKFKSKRACFNYFTKHYEFQYLPFSLRYKAECLKLYSIWMQGRKLQNQDRTYQGMLGDNLVCLKILLDDFRNLDCIGRVVKVDDRIKAFTFGYKLNQDIFCILFEIADLSIKGLSQFIFREFCQELTDYKYINIMDDSGLASLKKVKLSYHPTRLIPNYIIQRKNAPRSS